MNLAAVRYLNAFPLRRGLSGVRLGTPSEIASWLEDGSVHAALTSSIEAFRPGRRVLAGFGVCAEREVETVLLVGDPLQAGATLAPDPHSRTSNMLARIILSRRYALTPQVAEPEKADLRVIIGDAALTQRPHLGVHLDLAAEWHQLTGLPFVFAVWILRESAPSTMLAHQIQRGLQAPGLLEEATHRYPDFDRETIDRYLGRTLHYCWHKPFGESPEWEAMRLFYQLAKEIEPSLSEPVLASETPWSCST